MVLKGKAEGLTKSRRIVISGATRGLGLALAQGFKALGHEVRGCGSRTDLVAEWNEQYGTEMPFSVVDVTKDAQVAEWAERELALGVPDLLIANAAVIHAAQPLWEIPEDVWKKVMEVNVLGVVNMIRHFVPAMVKQERGVIATLSSGWGRSTSPGVSAYCASKYAIEGLTAALAQELPAGMAAVPVNPGVIATDMLREVWGAEADVYPDAGTWARQAVPFFLGLCPGDNGRQKTV